MNFKIGVATRTGDNEVNLQNMHIETFDEREEHEMAIELPNSGLQYGDQHHYDAAPCED